MGIELRGCCPLFQVFDMPTALAFYCDVLGFEIESHSDHGPGSNRDFDWVLLDRKGTGLMLNTAYERENRPLAPDPARIEVHADTSIYFGWEDLEGLYEHLRGQGIAARSPRVAHYGMKQLYVNDPDGFLLCFQWPATQATYDQWVSWYGLRPKAISRRAED
jgi:glyoxylase I family protein